MDRTIVKQAALIGDSGAQLLMGFMYEVGYGVATDHAEALSWYSKAAEAGSTIAQYVLGVRLSEQVGSSKNDIAQLMARAAERGLVAAQEYLAGCYDFGIGTPADSSLAMDWYVKAAKGGSSVAASRLAQLFDTGTYVAKNSDEAVMWYKRAADLGNASAALMLALRYERDTSDPSHKSSAVYWFQRAADLGDSHGHERLMDGYEKGLMGLPKDTERVRFHSEMMGRCRQKEKELRAARREELLSLIQEQKDNDS
jgi:TPR repeat protein